jgi:hypothetical protein
VRAPELERTTSSRPGAATVEGMTREQNPSQAEVEHDFTVPDDADLHPVAHPDEEDER